MAEVRWVTFDCFGTLVDWRRGISGGLELLFPGRGWELLEIYIRVEAVVQAEQPSMRYRDVMAETVRRVADEAGLELVTDNASVLGATIAYWPVFADVGPALAGLRAAGWRLALLTNCDRDIIGETQRRLGVHIDAVVTSEHVGSYKPSHNHFTQFAESFGATRENWVHAAQSYFHDIQPAHSLGIPSVWVNRLGQADDPSIAHAVVPDLIDLVRTVERVSTG
ncbi:2-haloacid dehalogenase [Kibdelosporangium banguiense]|uniref:2-haloacid dehalogenase n=1 Tax=Kibdelosporangium banguiense TaxID=1365924 RepID=A0ABS4U247_9PSEU|nr:HAD family hydrolase [Kibdelosporangium banguiense]MBP2330711.1 2-haloacid dehalogenase [Kibdelosporangium banguiense]